MGKAELMGLKVTLDPAILAWAGASEQRADHVVCDPRGLKFGATHGTLLVSTGRVRPAGENCYSSRIATVSTGLCKTDVQQGHPVK